MLLGCNGMHEKEMRTAYMMMSLLDRPGPTSLDVQLFIELAKVLGRLANS